MVTGITYKHRVEVIIAFVISDKSDWFVIWFDKSCLLLKLNDDCAYNSHNTDECFGE